MSKLRIGQIFRTKRPYAPSPEQVDGYPNHFAATYSPGLKLAVLERGINAMATLTGPEELRLSELLARFVSCQQIFSLG